jgi:radical SAM superfamily enzyme YgiQ (UPF0313 family)
MAAPPVGLSYVASAAQSAGHDVRVADLCFESDAKQALRTDIESFSPEIIGLSIRNIDNVNMLHPITYLPGIRKIAQFIREISSAPIVLGGSAVSLNPNGIIRYVNADYIVVSDGETSFLKLLKALENGAGAKNIPGVGIIKDGDFHFTPRDIKGIGFGKSNMGQWVDIKRYLKSGALYSIQAKRGCCYKCIYCVYQIIEGNAFRLREPREVVDELEEAHFKYGATDFEFVDSVFNRPFDHCVEILEEICRKPWKARFTATAVTPQRLDRQILDLMWRAGFRSLALSPESASEKVSRNYGKSFSIDDLVAAAEHLNKSDINSFWFFLLGGPGENSQTIGETIDFIQKYLTTPEHPPYHSINMFLGVRIHPGTTLWDIALKEGFISKNRDPLQQCWYISKDLDLERTIEQMMEAAVRCPELFLGFDEKALKFSRPIAAIGELVNMPKPYWRHIWGMNRALIKLGVRFMFKPKDLASMIRSQLASQGYQGKLFES